MRGSVRLARAGALTVTVGAALAIGSVRADGVWLLGVVLAVAGSLAWMAALEARTRLLTGARSPSGPARRAPWRSRPTGGAR